MSIVDQMGQSILAKAKKQREKEERNQLIGAAGNLATSIINQRLQDSANKFLESEEFLQARAKQQSAYNIGQANKKTYEESMSHENGQLGYADDKIYARLLTDFNGAFPEEDYSESDRKGYLRNLARERAASYVDSINKNFEAAARMRTPEEFEKAYAESAPGVRTAGEWLNSKIGGFFSNSFESAEDVRAKRLEALMSKSEGNREAIFQARQAMGQQTSLPKIAKVAEDIKAYKITREDYEIKTEKLDKLTAKFDDGETREVSALKVTLEHPNKPGVYYEELRVNSEDPASVAAFERGQFGSTVEHTTSKDYIGNEYDVYTTYHYVRTPNGYAKVKGVQKNNKRKLTAGDYMENLDPKQLEAATTNYNLVSRTLTAKGVDDKTATIADSQVTEAYISLLEGYDATKNENAAWKSDVAMNIATNSMVLRTNEILNDENEAIATLDTSQSNLLAATMQARYFNSTILIDDDWFIKYTGKGTIEPGDRDEIDLSMNNGLNSTTLDLNSSIYALDAYIALEESPGAQKVTMTDTQLAGLMEDARKKFAYLPPTARLHLIEGFKQYKDNRALTNYRGDGFNYIELLEQQHNNAMSRK